ncbi:membrane protein insertase YidC [Prosthecomicrobium hirschii]|uniref:membrane protein insertase YidC n=1 Tax=Prosthecodimorpha hirschii TaxID=665126 RepID=UPI00222034B9|nr:membrane protein insertase YidC [Prosthecomicrobium hirschii]MCW1841309.1 membrane protein insertase YidC [Prosthecomicrobium hirschii]
MIDNRNYIIAIGLSILIVIGWQYFVMGPRMEAERLRRVAEQSQIQTTQPATPGTPATPAAPGGTVAPATTAAQVVMSRTDALAKDPRVAIDTPALSGSINLKGARIDDIVLKGYRESVDPKSPQIVLLAPDATQAPYFAEFGWLNETGGSVKVPGPDAVWRQDGTGTLSATTPITLTWDNGDGLVFRRTIAVDAKYMFTVTEEVTATGDKTARLLPYSAMRRFGTPTTAGFYILHEGPIGVFGDEGLKEPSYKDLADKKKIEQAKVTGGWMGFVDKYWATAIIPDKDRQMQPIFASQKLGAVDTYQTFMVGDAVEVGAGKPAASSSRVFVGAKEVATVDGYADQFKIEKFDRLIDWGWFYFLTKPLFHVIDFLYKFLGNFGLAILVVTVILKGIFFPLANKSYDSMSKMKKVQPEMKELQERFKDDKMKQQQALMELYRREKINPLSGCLPILLQIPVFFALYKVLFVTIEMRQAPFYGWIKDLAAPDPTSLFNLFGLIPWDPPHALMIGVWPLIMGVTMFVQMKLNPAPPDPTQKMIFDWMPLIFTYMLASFPAGLVIYWAWNNTLSVAQQSIIMKKNGVKIELWDNVRGMFNRSKSATPS